MKKSSILLTVAAMLWAMTACGGLSQTDTNTGVPEPTASQSETPVIAPQPAEGGAAQQSGILIAYFSLWDNAPWEREGVDTTTSASVVVDENSAVGTTRYVAQQIQKGDSIRF